MALLLRKAKTIVVKEKSVLSKNRNHQLYVQYTENNGFDGFFIIKSGKALVINTLGLDQEFTELRSGDFFGESQIFKQPVSRCF